MDSVNFLVSMYDSGKLEALIVAAKTAMGIFESIYQNIDERDRNH